MAPPSPSELRVAADLFREWLRWYMREYPRTAPTQVALADRIGVHKSTITLLLKAGSVQIPDLRTVWGFSRLVGHPIDYVLTKPPPEK